MGESEAPRGARAAHGHDRGGAAPVLSGLIEVAVLVAALVALVANLWTGSLVNSDDAIYADMARTAVESGDWLDFRWHGAVLHEKPPILFWSVALSGALLGFDDFAVRLPGALFGFGILVLIWRHAGRLGLGRPARLLAVLLALASGCFYFTARRVMTDPPLVFFGLLSLDAWWAARDKPRRLVLWGLALGAAVLTKWLAAAPFALIPLVEGCFRRGRPFRTRWFVLGVLAALALAAPWHLLQTARHGAAFWEVYLGYHVLGRFEASLVGGSTPDYYLLGAWVREGALLLVWLAGVVALLLRAAKREPRAAWVAVWLLATLVPIHLAQTRLYHYLLPAIPALTLATALAFERWFDRRLVAAAVAALALALFAVNNGSDLVAPDYSSDARALTPDLRDLPARSLLAVIDDYDVAATWYAHRPVKLWATDPALAEAWSVDMMKRAGAVVYGAPPELAQRARQAEAVALFVPEGLGPQVAAWLGAADRAFTLQRAGRHLSFRSVPRE